MDPVSSNLMSNTCDDVISSNCVISQVNNLPCLNLCSPATVTQVENAIGGLLCNLVGELNSLETTVPAPVIDFSKLNYGCLYSPTITTYSCPPGQSFVPFTSAPNSTGYCQLCISKEPVTCGATTAVPVATVTPNPVPPPNTLLGVIQLLINAIPCCNPCDPNHTGSSGT